MNRRYINTVEINKLDSTGSTEGKKAPQWSQWKICTIPNLMLIHHIGFVKKDALSLLSLNLFTSTLLWNLGPPPSLSPHLPMRTMWNYSDLLVFRKYQGRVVFWIIFSHFPDSHESAFQCHHSLSKLLYSDCCMQSVACSLISYWIGSNTCHFKVYREHWIPILKNDTKEKLQKKLSKLHLLCKYTSFEL